MHRLLAGVRCLKPLSRQTQFRSGEVDHRKLRNFKILKRHGGLAVYLLDERTNDALTGPITNCTLRGSYLRDVLTISL